MDRRNAIKLMGLSLASLAMASVAPKAHAAILRDRASSKKRLVFYFTATGNSLFIARQFSDNPLSIPQELKKEPQNYEADEIGFVFPDYTAAAPLIVRDFIEKNNFKASYFFTIVTYGHYCANVAEWWKDFAAKKGVDFDYVNTLLMVDNYLPVFDINEELKLEKHTDENLAILLEHVAAHKSYVQEAQQEEGRPPMDFAALEGRRQFQYAVKAQDAMDLDRNKCIQCMKCELVCPQKNFSLGNFGVQYSGTCQHCLACVHACPQKALTLKSPMPNFPGERNPNARYRHPRITLQDIIRSNRQ